MDQEHEEAIRRNFTAFTRSNRTLSSGTGKGRGQDAMPPEHEEAMRREFTEFIGMRNQAQRPVSETSVEVEMDLYDRMRPIKDRWLDGPHARQWEYLERAWFWV